MAETKKSESPKPLRLVNVRQHSLTQGRGFPLFEPDKIVILKPEEVTGWVRCQMAAGYLKEL